jgi:hypothetical protein
VLESRLQAMPGRKIAVVYRLKPELQRLVARLEDTV